MEKGLISVIVPVYNVKEYLENSINSIINQSYKKLEIIFVNDGSSDGSDKILDEYEKKDTRIKVIHKENEGVSIARNTALDKANGEFITFVDADDWLDDDFLESLVNEIEGFDVVVGEFKEIKDSENFERPFVHFEKDEEVGFDRFFEQCGDNIIYTYLCWGKLFRKEAIGGKRFYSLAFSEDTIFCREVLSTVDKIKLVCKDGYNYRISTAGVSQDTNRVEERSAGSLTASFRTIDLYKKGTSEKVREKLYKFARVSFGNYIKRAAKYKIHDKEICKKLLSRGLEMYGDSLTAFEKMLVKYIKVKTR